MNKQAEFTRLLEAAHAIIFDFDGVLACSERWHFVTYEEVFTRYGHTLDETEYYKYWTSLGHGARGEIERHDLDLDPVAIRAEKQPLFTERCRGGAAGLDERWVACRLRLPLAKAPAGWRGVFLFRGHPILSRPA